MSVKDHYNYTIRPILHFTLQCNTNLQGKIKTRIVTKDLGLSRNKIFLFVYVPAYYCLSVL